MGTGAGRAGGGRRADGCRDLGPEPPRHRGRLTTGPAAWADDCDAAQRAAGTPERAVQERACLKSSIERCGVSVPGCRAVAKAFVKAHPGLGHDDVCALVDSLWLVPVFERRRLAVDPLERCVGQMSPNDLPMLERLLRESRTWALVDELAPSVVGPLVERHPELGATLDRWAVDPDFWIRRGRCPDGRAMVRNPTTHRRFTSGRSGSEGSVHAGGRAATAAPRAPVVLLPAAAVIVLIVLGRPVQALAVAVGAALLIAATQAGLPVAGAFRRLGEWVGALLLGGIFLITVVPAWAITSVRDRRKVRPGWITIDHAVEAPSSLSSRPAPNAGHHGLLATAWRAVGIVAVLLGINYAIGYGWEKALDPPPGPAAAPQPIGPPADGEAPPEDPRVNVAAMAAYPWRAQYFREMNSADNTYWPYLVYRPMDFRGRYVNIEGFTRRSYRPADRPTPMPTVAFFGGSKVWGEGQRDEFTIPSQVARLAEAAGVPIVAVNHGQRGWVNWQGMLLFEQLTAEGERPDFALFYDGTNDLNAQQLGLTVGVPATTNDWELAQRFADDSFTVAPPAAVETTDAGGIGAAWSDLLAAYRERSAIHRLLAADPAGAAPADEPEVDTSGWETLTAERVPIILGATLDVYERGRRMISEIADERDVTPIFIVEQQISLRTPEGAPADIYGRYLQMVEGLADAGPDVIDIANVLDDHQDTYIDPGHTNEAGAEIVAQAMFDEIEPQLRAWYRDNG